MSRQSAVIILILIAGVFVFAAANSPLGDCNCPDQTGRGAFQTLIDKELASAEGMATSKPFFFAKTMTVCMGFDQTNKGYPPEMRLVAEGSIDGRTWFPLTIAGTDRRAETINTCLQVSPARFVRVGWPPSANVASPGPHVTASVQASY